MQTLFLVHASKQGARNAITALDALVSVLCSNVDAGKGAVRSASIALNAGVLVNMRKEE